MTALLLQSMQDMRLMDRVESSERGRRVMNEFAQIAPMICGTGDEFGELLDRLRADEDAYRAACRTVQKLLERRRA